MSTLTLPRHMTILDAGDGARFEPKSQTGVSVGVSGYLCWTIIGTGGNFLLATPSGIGRCEERDPHAADFRVWTPAGAIYEGCGKYRTKGRWPEPPTTFTATAEVTNVDQPRDRRSVRCTWVRPLDGNDKVILDLN